MSILILDSRDYELTIQDGLLRCFHPDKGARLLPWNALAEIIIGYGVIINSDVLIKLSEYGIGVIISGQRIKQLSSLHPLAAPTSDFKLQQYRLFSQSAYSNDFACLILKLRAKSQLKTLHKLGIATPSEWFISSTKLTSDQPHLMLIEAQLSHCYWKALCPVISEYGFLKRQRRPPPDPCNALFSLASTLEDPLYARALLSQGFDIGLGVLHATGYNRQSLILDLKELTRSIIEYWVINLFLYSQISVDDFDVTENGCLLTMEGKRKFYPLWFSFCKSHQKRIYRIAKMAKLFLLQKVKVEHE